MTALEMQFAALSGVSKLIAGATPVNPSPNDGAVMHHLPTWLRQSDSYSWSVETSRAVSAASVSLPALATVTRAAISGSGFGWWWLGHESPLTLRNDPIVAILHALFWRAGAPGAVCLVVFVHPFSAKGPALRYLHGATFPVSVGYVTFAFGQPLTEVSMENDDLSRAAQFFLAGTTWLQQRVVVESSGHVERHRRKQLAREHNAPLPSDVKVIQLRRSESSSRVPGATDTESVDWSCRWIVNGHWRNQPYKDERKLIYILPYVKGPDDKPLKVPAHTVYDVSR